MKIEILDYTENLLKQQKCEYTGYCKEKHSCGRYPRREEYVKAQDATRANRVFRGTRPEQ